MINPIKLLFRKKVERYQKLLDEINSRKSTIFSRSRACGKTITMSNIVIQDFCNEIKYTKFINRWKIK